MSFRSLLFLPAALSALALSGCGGGPNNTTVPPPVAVVGPGIAINDTASTDTSTLQAYGLDPKTGSTNSQRGTLNRSTGAVDLGSLSGTVSSSDANGTYVTLAVGGQLAVVYGTGSEQYVAFYSAQPTNGDDATLGIVGVPSDATKLPTTGSASYSGEAQVGITDGNSAFYTLTGTSSSTVNFGSKTVDTTLSALSGTKTDSGGVQTHPNNVVDVSINGAKLVNDTFSGGTASITNSTLSVNSLSGSQVVTNSGNLYGPGGAEIGGVFVINDPASGSLLLQGSYLGAQP